MTGWTCPIAVLSCIWLASVTRAAESTPAKGPDLGNAALQYWQAFALMEDSGEQEPILLSWRTAALAAATLQLLKANQTALQYLHRGAAIGRCDWGLAMEEGPGLPLPHLSKARSLFRLACLQARHDFEHGLAEQAVQGTLCAFVLSRHVAAENLLVSLLVRCAMEQALIELVSEHLMNLEPAVLRRLSDGLEKLPRGGTMAEAILCEREIGVRWMLRRIRESEKDTVLVDPVFGPIGGQAQSRDAAEALALNVKSAADYLEELDSYYQELARLLSLPADQFQGRIGDLERKIQANPFGKATWSAVRRAYENDARIQARMAMLRAAVAFRLSGPEALQRAQDPYGQGPFRYRPLEKGFELQSALSYRGQPVSLRVGSLKAKQ